MSVIKIKHEAKEFNIKIEKLIYVLSKLENDNNLKYENQEQIENLMEKYELFDEYFLNNINKI